MTDMLTFAAIKILLSVIFSRLGKMLAFAFEHWRVFLPMAMVCLAIWYVHSLRSERDDALASLADYQAQVEDAKRQRRILNMVIERRLELELARVDAVHEAQMTTLMENYNAQLDDKSKRITDIADFNGRLRQQLEAFTAARMSEDRSGSLRSAESGGDCHATDSGYDVAAYLDTLEYAAADTTLNYNTLWQRCDAAIRAANGTQ
ncbi:hypothetical protein MTYP_01061 [Methylophilaceae bacterium]|nr:hypothetical protein MTYP_01061 [Methylophilaceae bacterium]